MFDNKSSPEWLQMYNVNFSFPNGIGPQNTPGGQIIESYVTFPDNPVPYRIAIGLGSSPNTPSYDYTTVLSTHKEPQAGFTIHNGTIQLLVNWSKIHSSIAIEGLKETYRTGEPIDFQVNASGFDYFDAGSTPDINITKSDGTVIWENPHYVVLCCVSELTDFNRSFDLIKLGGPVVLNQTGLYKVVVHYNFQTMTRDFSVINPKGTQVDLTNVSVWTCGAGRKIATFVDTSGFVNITKANEYAGGLPVDWNDFFDFVLKPNSTGYINMSFEFIGESYNINKTPFNGTIQSSIGFQRSTISDLFNKTAIYTLDDPYSPHPSNLDGISIFATNIENVTNHTLKLTYVIKIDPSARDGTYGLGIPYTCPIELLTVGDHPFTGSIPWHRGTY